jgi:hypothetical protein
VSEGRPYFLLSRASAFESGGVLVVDPQAVKECRTEDEVETAFNELSLPDFAAQYRGQLRAGERLVSVSKIVSLCDQNGNSSEVARDDLKVVIF